MVEFEQTFGRELSGLRVVLPKASHEAGSVRGI